MHQISESEELKALWQETAKTMGSAECSHKRTWKQTCCILSNRWANPTYEYNIVSEGLMPDLKKSNVRLKGSWSESGLETDKEDGYPYIEINEQSVALWHEEAETKELLPIVQPEKFSLNACALHGSLLAITFCNPSSCINILQVWNLETKHKVLEHVFDYHPDDLQIGATCIVLRLYSAPKTYGVFILFSKPQSIFKATVAYLSHISKVFTVDFWRSAAANEKSLTQSG